VLLSEDDVALFARASGDRNPLHCSAEYARSTPFGGIVAHGALALLATLDEQQPRATGVSAVEAEFGSPVQPNVRYRSESSGASEGGLHCRLLDGDRVCLTARVKPGLAPDLSAVAVPPIPAAVQQTIADLPAGTTVSGGYGPAGIAELVERFPAAARMLGRMPLTCLLWSSYLAGMCLPGERCLLTSVSLRLIPVAITGSAQLRYSATVVHADPRFGLVSISGRITADGETVAGADIEAMVRSPAPMPASASIAAHLHPSTRLRGSSAVVAGGSRGLGAAISLALAGQGCEVFVGHRGKLPEELSAQGVGLPGRLRSVPGDAANPEWSGELGARIERERGRLDFLVCAAAPPIRPLGLLPAHLQRVDDFLVAGVRLVSAPFAGLLGPLERAGGRCLVISSAAVLEPPRDWPHYVAAKTAVEGLVHWAARQHPDVVFLLARPEALRTEQMNTPGAWETARPVEPVAADLTHRLLGAAPATGVPVIIGSPTAEYGRR
jgi:NAD(P)-dependent dehydrogenase (short-subunit alcohol dehydrogenase family)